MGHDITPEGAWESLFEDDREWIANAANEWFKVWLDAERGPQEFSDVPLLAFKMGAAYASQFRWE